MSDHLTIAAPGARYSSQLVPITGDRLIYPSDLQSDAARIVLRWGRRWAPQTWAARAHFAKQGHGNLTDEVTPTYSDELVTGWLLLPPEPASLAARVRSGELDVATALCVEAEAWGRRLD
ncbi:hypothetical protein BAY61_27520 [Prauserella marina]|uniref:Uncharacterized protein n=1 Tax=Prauserella marina TaxID=530584 RepID=A0A222VW32_9PSEU|nr:hypothetical protein [Prauserella marina]ASR38138.1 hypothetical protein BAY61_27520 [Prauserella marina]PWV78699.1 hypothetical protein DES30_104436 [Prauserella marina]SDC91770.1 hypothetical protein SAMN05421630_104435 [Prauserella marina]